ncbi:MAG: hypothetical protein MUD01_11485 [Chloroflexaceae bacterium]|nr:hypothetical protein [Chloroflexaceae bacterium]
MRTATFDAANQLLTLNGVRVQYDGRGNLLNDGVQQYRYDALNRLRSSTRAG